MVPLEAVEPAEPVEPVESPPEASPFPVAATRVSCSISSPGSTREPTRRRSLRPRTYARTNTPSSPAARAGIIGTKMSAASSLSAVAARAVGPPQGRVFITPLAVAATPVMTTKLRPSRLYSGYMAETVIMKVVEPSPSSETIAASTAVPTTTLIGSALQKRRMPRTIGSNRPTSIITPK